MQQPDDPFLGRRIRGYCLEELLGRGTLTAVYRGRTDELWLVPELIITILLVPQTLSEQARIRFRTRFMSEARRMAQVRHPHLLPLYGYGEQEELFYLLTPPLEGEPLTRFLLQRKRWSASEVLSILAPLATLFEYLQDQELVHPFFNPANVLIQGDGTILFSGLGLAQLLSMKDLNEEKSEASSYEHLSSIAGTFLGTPEYLSPEIIKGGEIDSRSTIYTLGILLFAMLSGAPPFSGGDYREVMQKHIREPLPSLHSLAPDLPIALELVVNRALHRNPNSRFQSLSEFIAAYSHVIDERINVPKPARLVQTLQQMKALPLPGPTAPLLLSAPHQEQDTYAQPVPLPKRPARQEEEADTSSRVSYAIQMERAEAQADDFLLSESPKKAESDIFQRDEADLLFEEQGQQPITPFQENISESTEVHIKRVEPLTLDHRVTSAPPFQTGLVATSRQTPQALATNFSTTSPQEAEQSARTGETLLHQDNQPARGKIAAMVHQIKQMKERLQSQSHAPATRAFPEPQTTDVYQVPPPQVREIHKRIS